MTTWNFLPLLSPGRAGQARLFWRPSWSVPDLRAQGPLCRERQMPVILRPLWALQRLLSSGSDLCHRSPVGSMDQDPLAHPLLLPQLWLQGIAPAEDVPAQGGHAGGGDGGQTLPFCLSFPDSRVDRAPGPRSVLGGERPARISPVLWVGEGIVGKAWAPCHVVNPTLGRRGGLWEHTVGPPLYYCVCVRVCGCW